MKHAMKRGFVLFAASLAATFSVSSAAQEGETPSANETTSSEEEAVKRAYLNAQQAYLSGLQAQDGWYTMEGGLRWRYVDYVGRGDSPTAADTVTVNYEGTFVDGKVFDSSFERGTPATFPLSGLIPAWEMAIPQMRVGETIELAAPASLAYGPRGRGPIPGGATLLFKVELISIEGR